MLTELKYLKLQSPLLLLNLDYYNPKQEEMLQKYFSATNYNTKHLPCLSKP